MTYTDDQWREMAAALKQPKPVNDLDLPASHPLVRVFADALKQATHGKGEQRHGRGIEFMDQPWRHIARTHGRGFLTGQAAKKLEEAQRMDRDAWRREMYGVLVYVGMALLYDEEMNGPAKS